MEFVMQASAKPSAQLAGWSADEAGATAIEYALLASLIAVAIVGAVSATGDAMVLMYVYWSSEVIAAL
jgi:pilus assembly protein Flp/PilA